VFVDRQPRPLAFFLGLAPTPCQSSPNSFGVNPFADPHPLTPMPSIFYKKGGGEGGTLKFQCLSTCALSSCPPMSNRIISFADHHPLIPLESYRFKNIAGALLHSRAPRFAERAPLISTLPKSFICNTCGPSRKCCKHRAYKEVESMLSPLDATLTKNRGVPVAPLMVVRHSRHVVGHFWIPPQRRHLRIIGGGEIADRNSHRSLFIKKIDPLQEEVR